MKVKIALSPLQTYTYPIMNWKGIKVTAQCTYGGEDSEAVPCGFVTQLVYEKVKTKTQKKNEKKRLKYKVKSLDKFRGLASTSTS